MYGTDMILVQAVGTEGKAYDLWSVNHNSPTQDSSQDIDPGYSFNSTYVKVVMNRKLNTGDSKDYAIPLVSA